MCVLRWVLLSTAVVIALALASPRHASATSVSPIQLEMTAAGPKSRMQVTATNSGQAPLALEAQVQRIELDENGQQTTTKAGDEFLIFPPQAMVPPGGTQVFRVEWLGGPDLAKSQSFQLALSQIPVKLPKNQTAAVQVVMSFGVLINVAPAKGAPQVKLVGTGIDSVGDKKATQRRPTITVENASNVHALLQDATIRLSSGSWSQTLSPGDFAQKVGMGLVQPGKRRKFTLPFEVPASVTTIQASIDYTPKRP